MTGGGILLASIWCPGTPRPKGSLTNRNGQLVDTEQSSRWRQLMAERFRARRREVIGEEPSAANAFLGAVRVEAIFTLPLDPLHPQSPDLDKLLRNLLDAMASDADNERHRGYVIGNDRQVVEIEASKGRVGGMAGTGHSAAGVWCIVETA